MQPAQKEVLRPGQLAFEAGAWGHEAGQKKESQVLLENQEESVPGGATAVLPLCRALR